MRLEAQSHARGKLFVLLDIQATLRSCSRVRRPRPLLRVGEVQGFTDATHQAVRYAHPVGRKHNHRRKLHVLCELAPIWIVLLAEDVQ